MKKNKYSAPAAAIQRFSEEYVAAASAITATVDALKNGDLTVNGENVSNKPMVSVRF